MGQIKMVAFLSLNRMYHSFLFLHCLTICIFHLIYSSSIVEAPIINPHITEPLWNLPFARVRTIALSQGLSSATATYFIVKTKVVTISHDNHPGVDGK
jgi:hypothetical protein